MEKMAMSDPCCQGGDVMLLKASRPTDGTSAPRRSACPLCDSKRLYFHFSLAGHRLEKCEDCGFQLLNPSPAKESGLDSTAEQQCPTACYLDDVARYRGETGGHLLAIGWQLTDFVQAALAAGYQVTGVDLCASAVDDLRHRAPEATILAHATEDLDLVPGSVDVCVLCGSLERSADPLRLLLQVRRLLRPNGSLCVTTPSLDSRPAQRRGQKWSGYSPDQRCWFGMTTMQSLLYKAGFGQVMVRPGRSAVIRVMGCGIPTATNTLAAFARPAAPLARPRLSVILPAYNEATTFTSLMDLLLNKEVPGLDIEVVVVESNSRDGTRELALAYQHHPRVRLVLEDRPRGKGHAVRTGLTQATGDFILIQDADREYDLDDYEPLLEPLRQGRANFVLGSRHGGNARNMRQFEGQRTLSSFLNLGHLLFATLVNLLFGLRLKDPFTMYKVFRRDCLAGLTFTCNRFDFDYELLIQLVRKGFRPIEIPVNYRSRSFKEGKKVSMIRDPLTWLWALARLRLLRMDPLGAMGKQPVETGAATSGRRLAA
jgi:SAM-dependent methyltransferase